MSLVWFAVLRDVTQWGSIGVLGREAGGGGNTVAR